jgi:hypothetical protein
LGFGKSIGKGVDVGLIGYYQQLVIEEDGHGASNQKSHVVASDRKSWE